MANIIKLTMQDRFDILKYAKALPSTTSTYFRFPEFEEIFEITPEEESEYAVSLDDGKLCCNCPDKLFDIDIEPIPEAIHDAIKLRITEYKDEMEKLRKVNRGNQQFSDSPFFCAFIKALSKLLTPEELAETEPSSGDKKQESARQPKLSLIDMLRTRKGK